LVRIEPGQGKSVDEIRKRFEIYYGKDDKRELTEELIPALREKWGSLAEFVKEIKQGFSRFYNRRHHRKGFFWSERFKSVIVDNGETLINCLAYIDLNPIRAGIAKKPEEYRWCSLGYHVQAKNRDRFLSTDFGLRIKFGTGELCCCGVVGGEVAEDLFDRGLCLPSGTAMTNNDLDRVIETILKCKK